MLAEQPLEESKNKPSSSSAGSGGDSAVRTALQCAYSILQERIISNPNDMMGILLFGTQASDGRLGEGPFDHVQLLMDLDVPEASEIRVLKQLLEDDDEFARLLAPCDEAGAGMAVPIATVLLAANQIFTTKAANFLSRKLFLITDDDDPHGRDKALRTAAVTRARDLYDLSVRIDPIFMATPGHAAAGVFDTRKFYDDIIYRSPHADDADDDNANRLATGGLSGSGSTRLKEMVTSIRCKAAAKRALFSTTLEIGPGLVVGVKGYALYRKQEKGRSHFIYTRGETAQIVQSTTTLLAEVTAQAVERSQLTKAYNFGGEHVLFSAGEMRAMRDFGPPGLRIVGFKPAALALRFDLNVKPAQFLYPDERDYVGSTRTLAALHAKLVRDAKVALVWAITRRSAPPALCCLSPSVEIVDPDSHRQIQPAGFFLITLPFADDVRSNPPPPVVLPAEPTDPSSATDPSAVRAPTALIDRMRAVVRTLHLPRGYEPDKFPNPSLQWHYRILQAIALQEDMPEHPPDKTLPKFRLIAKHVGPLVAAWAAEFDALATPLFGAGGGGGGAKRLANAAVGAGPPKKARTAAVADAATRVRDAYSGGLLHRCTVPVLREFLAGAGLSTAGLKADLVARTEDYLDRK